MFNVFGGKCVKVLDLSVNETSLKVESQSKSNCNIYSKVLCNYDRKAHKLKQKKSVNQSKNSINDRLKNSRNVKVRKVMINNVDLMVKRLSKNNGNDNVGYNWNCRCCKAKFRVKGEIETDISAMMIICNKDRSFKCDVCNEGLGMIKNWNKGKVCHSSKYKCKICKLKCFGLFDLKHHERMHNAEKRFTCNFCKKRFFCMDSWQRHQRGYQCHKYSKHQMV